MTQPPTPSPAARPDASRSRWTPALVTTAVLVAAAVVYLRTQGRLWWCKFGDASPFSSAVDAHNSQHLFDLYSPSHLIHGLIFFGIFWLFRRQIAAPWRFLWGVVLETAWEVFENSPFVIDRYRTATASLGYTGDSLANTAADIVCAAVGWFVARRLGLWRSLALAVALELITLLWIRDNLTLNVLMLLYPVQAVKTWQGGG